MARRQSTGNQAETVPALSGLYEAEGAATAAPVEIVVYVTQHCDNCRYAREVAGWIRSHYPDVQVRVVDLETTREAVPEAVFATPTYLLNGRVWSLGNPSQAKIQTTLQAMAPER